MKWLRKSCVMRLFSSRIKGGALYYAIFVMVILNMIGLMLLTYFELTFKEDALFYQQNKLEDDANSAIEMLCCQPGLVTPGEKKELDLYDDGESMVTVEVQRWGALRKAIVTSRWRTQEFTKTVLLAEKENVRPALWMPEHHQYVSLVGKSYIKGDCFLSELGLRKGNAEGRYFEGPYLHKGKLNKTSNEMVNPDPIFLKYMEQYGRGKFSGNDSVVVFGKDGRITGYSQSFSEKTIVVNGGSTFHLTNESFNGNVILYARDSIIIGNGAQLDWSILISKVVVVNPGFKGRLQVIADSLIKVGPGCELKYPSFLMTINRKPGVCVEIDSKTDIKGGIMVYSFNPEKGKTKLIIGKETNVYGKAYTNGDASLIGNIFGSLYCDRFVKLTAVSFYENFMIDCTIDEEKLPDEFSSYCLDKEINKLRLVSLVE
jgi:hypothetical protein